MPRKVYKRYKAKSPECKARISASVRAYHQRCREALAAQAAAPMQTTAKE